MNRPRLFSLVGALAMLPQLLLAQVAHPPPQQVGDNFVVEPSAQSRSGLLRLRGTGFGTGAGSEIRVGGLKAPVARWEDNLIECYVPEAVPLGSSFIQLISGAGPKRSIRMARLNVLARESLTGRFRWRLKLPDQYVSTRPAIGPDGSVYAIGNFGHVYAVTSAGAIKWVAAPSGGVGGTIDVLPNGNVVVGGGGGVQVLSHLTGERLWNFSINTPLVAGPNVGPDGNIYAVDDSRWSQDVIGAFVLSPSGQLLWSGGKYYRRGGGWTPQQIRFGGGNAYFWSDYSSTGDPDVLGGMNALALGGGLRWRITDGVGIMPNSAPSGQVSMFRPSSVDSYNSNGHLLWSQSLGNLGQPQDEAIVASDGRTYFRTTNTKLHAISPTGQVLYSKLIGGVLSNITLRPDANQIALQFQPNFGVAAQIQGYDKNGTLQWSSQLPIELGTTIVCYNHMLYNGAGTMLYFGTAGPYTAQLEAHCYLYGLSTE